MNDDGEVEALRLLVSPRLPLITQQHLVGTLVLIRGECWIERTTSYAFPQRGRTDQVDVYCPLGRRPRGSTGDY